MIQRHGGRGERRKKRCCSPTVGFLRSWERARGREIEREKNWPIIFARRATDSAYRLDESVRNPRRQRTSAATISLRPSVGRSVGWSVARTDGWLVGCPLLTLPPVTNFSAFFFNLHLSFILNATSCFLQTYVSISFFFNLTDASFLVSMISYDQISLEMFDDTF